jgi:hypothetical protein
VRRCRTPAAGSRPVQAGGAAAVAVLLAERLVGLEHAGGEDAAVDRWVLAAHEPGEASVVDEDDTGEAGLVAELGQPAPGLAGGRSAELGVLVGVDHGEEVFAAGEGLFGLDLGAEAGVGGA